MLPRRGRAGLALATYGLWSGALWLFGFGVLSLSDVEANEKRRPPSREYLSSASRVCTNGEPAQVSNPAATIIVSLGGELRSTMGAHHKYAARVRTSASVRHLERSRVPLRRARSRARPWGPHEGSAFARAFEWYEPC